MRRVLVTGRTTVLGRRLAKHLRENSEATETSSVHLAGDTDHRELVDLIAKQEIDTILHCGMVPERSGRSDQPSGADVIGTMRLCATACHKSLPVRSLVIASSSSVYPAVSHVPLLHREDSKTEPEPDSFAASILEAEDYARDVAERMPHLSVCILRLGDLIGPRASSPLSALLRGPVVPSILGFDPTVQFLHIDDAVNALAFAIRVELPGLYNVASAGTVRWSEARAQIERIGLPLLPIEPGLFEPLLRQLKLPHLPNGLISTLRFGRALDTAKLSASGCTPTHDQLSCLGSSFS